MTKVVSLIWYDGKNGMAQPDDTPVLVICYDNGRVQIMKNETDDGKIINYNLIIRNSKILFV